MGQKDAVAVVCVSGGMDSAVTAALAARDAELALRRQGTALGVPLALTWSCYVAGDVACGACESCVLRRRGFEEAGILDPIPYRTKAQA